MTTNTNAAPIGADVALALLVAAVEAETDPSWECNSYHPSLWPALKAARAALARAAHAAAPKAAPAAVAGQCEDAIELLGKYKELCEEIKRGDSYHIGRIDAAISVLAQAAPPPAAQQSGYQSALSIRTAQGWKLTGKSIPVLYTDTINGEPVGRDDVWLCTSEALANQKEPAPVAQGDAEDAARYRFLAAHCRSTPEHWGGRWSIVVEGPAPKSHDSEDDFDAAIDAARAQAKEGDTQ